MYINKVIFKININVDSPVLKISRVSCHILSENHVSILEVLDSQIKSKFLDLRIQTKLF